METLQRVSVNFWFDRQAEEAAKYYTGIFKNSSIGQKVYYGKEGFEAHQIPAGTLLTIAFTLDGQEFLALNGGPVFKFNEAISLVVNCQSQEEIDYYWEKLGAGGDPKAHQCGWLKDKFGVSWQVVPTALPVMLADKDEKKASRVMLAMLKMKKLDLPTLQKAYNGNHANVDR